MGSVSPRRNRQRRNLSTQPGEPEPSDMSLRHLDRGYAIRPYSSTPYPQAVHRSGADLEPGLRASAEGPAKSPTDAARRGPGRPAGPDRPPWTEGGSSVVPGLRNQEASEEPFRPGWRGQRRRRAPRAVRAPCAWRRSGRPTARSAALIDGLTEPIAALTLHNVSYRTLCPAAPTGVRSPDRAAASPSLRPPGGQGPVAVVSGRPPGDRLSVAGQSLPSASGRHSAARSSSSSSRSLTRRAPPGIRPFRRRSIHRSRFSLDGMLRPGANSSMASFR